MAPVILAQRATTTTTQPLSTIDQYLADHPDIAKYTDLPEWVDRTFYVLAIIVVSWIAQRLVRKFIRRVVVGLQGEVAERRLTNLRRRTPRALLPTGENVRLRRVQRAETIGALLRSASSIVIFLFAFALIYKALNIESIIRPFLAATGVGAVVIAFGAQSIIRDFLSGVFIVLEDQYGVGDFIDVGKASGTVEAVSLRITRLRGDDGRLWHIPNGEIKSVSNFSQQWARSLIDLRIDIDSDIPYAIKIIKREADDMWNDSAYAGIVIDEPEIWGPESIDANGVLIKLAVKTKPLEQWQISRTLRSRIKKAFDREGILMAKPLLVPAPVYDKNAQATAEAK